MTVAYQMYEPLKAKVREVVENTENQSITFEQKIKEISYQTGFSLVDSARILDHYLIKKSGNHNNFYEELIDEVVSKFVRKATIVEIEEKEFREESKDKKYVILLTLEDKKEFYELYNKEDAYAVYDFAITRDDEFIDVELLETPKD